MQARHGALAAGTPVLHAAARRRKAAPGFRYRELERRHRADADRVRLAHAADARTRDTPALDIARRRCSAPAARRDSIAPCARRQLASSVSAYNYTPTTLGVFVVHAETPPERAAEAARAIWAQLRAVREHGVTRRRGRRARSGSTSRGGCAASRTWKGRRTISPSGRRSATGDAATSIYERALAVTRERRCTDVARRYLDPDQRGHRALSSGRRRREVAATPRRCARCSTTRRPPTCLPPPPRRIAARRRVHARLRIEREESGVRVYRTERGRADARAPQGRARCVHAGVYALGGARDEPPSRPGSRRMLVRTALKGTVARSAAQIAEEGELLGGSVIGGAAARAFGWSISVPARYAAEAVELLADVVQSPTIPDDALETERAIALADLAALRDDMYRYPMRLATTAAFAGHPYGVPVSGDESDAARASPRSACGSGIARSSSSGPAVIAVVGDADHDELAAMVASQFGALTRRRRRCHSSGPRGRRALRAARGAAREGADRARDAVSRPVAHRRRAVRRGDDRRRREWTWRPLLRRAARQAVARLHGAGVRERARAGGRVRGVHRDVAGEGGRGARAGCSPSSRSCARRRSPATELAQAQTYAIGTHAIRQQSGGAVLGDMVDAYLFGELARAGGVRRPRACRDGGSDAAVAREYFDEIGASKG